MAIYYIIKIKTLQSNQSDFLNTALDLFQRVSQVRASVDKVYVTINENNLTVEHPLDKQINETLTRLCDNLSEKVVDYGMTYKVPGIAQSHKVYLLDDKTKNLYTTETDRVNLKIVYLRDILKNLILPYYRAEDGTLIPASKYEVTEEENSTWNGWVVQKKIKESHLYDNFMKTPKIQGWKNAFNSPTSRFGLVLKTGNYTTECGTSYVKFITNDIKEHTSISKLSATDIENHVKFIFYIEVAIEDIENNYPCFYQVFAHEFFIHVERMINEFKKCLKLEKLRKSSKEETAEEIKYQNLLSNFMDEDSRTKTITKGGDLDHAKFIMGFKQSFNVVIHELLMVLDEKEAKGMLKALEGNINMYLTNSRYIYLRQYLTITEQYSLENLTEKLMKQYNIFGYDYNEQK